MRSFVNSFASVTLEVFGLWSAFRHQRRHPGYEKESLHSIYKNFHSCLTPWGINTHLKDERILLIHLKQERSPTKEPSLLEAADAVEQKHCNNDLPIQRRGSDGARRRLLEIQRILSK